AAYGIVSWVAIRECSRLREQFPYVSMEERLVQPRTPGYAQVLQKDTEKNLAGLEGLVDNHEPLTWLDESRLEQLEQLHEDVVRVFSSRSGFGVARMRGLSPWTLQAV